MTKNHHPIKDHLNIFGPALLLIIAGFILAYQFVQPAPPTKIRIATGSETGAYHLFGKRFAEFVAQEQIELELVTTEGSQDNIALLQSSKVDIAFVQSGAGTADQATDLRALGSLYFEPVWLFSRKQLTITQLTDLTGKRVAIGHTGSGTHPVALQLLTDNAISDTDSQLLALGGEASAKALLNGEIDAAFFIASPQSPLVRQLLTAEQIQLFSFERAEAYTRRHRYLSAVTLPEGVIDLQRNIPAEKTTLLAASANLVGTDDLHPALIDLLLQGAQEIYAKGGWFEQPGQFPSPDYLDFPLLKEAERYYKYGPPFLQRYLPFWAATLVDRLKVMILPLLALMLPLIKIMPPIYRWRMRSRIYCWYRDILAVDRQLRDNEITPEPVASC
ncbi:MAG: TAXI family TRAP transporter solute-binding subunit [Chromatiales bacterium]|nr:TAXI family TRAP transporter solute-binding subunit [Chromatiales bacterium]